MTNKIAQINLAPPGGYKGYGPLGLEQGQESVSVFAQFISTSIGLITLIAFIWFIFVFFIGALGILTSGGDKGANEAAKKKISSGVIGLATTVLGMVLVKFVGTLIGIPNILDFVSLFETLKLQ